MTMISSHTYPIDSLLSVFQKALDDKTAAVQAMAIPAGDWREQHPDGNTKFEQAAVDFLKAAQATGTQLVTAAPLSDKGVHGHSLRANPHHSLFMQIKNNMILTV